MKAAMAKIATALIGTALLAGCAGIHNHRGAVIDAELVPAITVGVDNRESVERTLGKPTFTGTFADADWYYVSRDTTQFAFRSPKVEKQTVLHIRFDAAGNVAAIEQTGPELIANINPVNDKTPTLGRQNSFFEDIFGNIGTVNAPVGPGQSGERP